MFVSDIMLGIFIVISGVAYFIAGISYVRSREKRMLKLSLVFGLMLLKGLVIASQYFTSLTLGSEIPLLLDLAIAFTLFALFW